MNQLQTTITNYLDYCQNQKRLDSKTLKAYRIDLNQFIKALPTDKAELITPDILEQYISNLHQNYKPKTVKRKIASIKAFFHYLEYKDFISINPFHKIQTRFREPVVLPRTIPLHTIENILRIMYQQKAETDSHIKKKKLLRDIAIIELLFATGMRISELCNLKESNVDLYDRNILILGKGSKERNIQIGNDDVVKILNEYQQEYLQEIKACGFFFVNNLGQPITDQSVRNRIRKYCKLASVEQHITPHMFRHTFATSLLEQDVDIRYIQEMLGHSSINITQIYTHVAIAKQRDILTTKHPRNGFEV